MPATIVPPENRHGRTDTTMRMGWMVTALLLGGLVLSARAADPPSEGDEFFEKKVRPVLVEHCYKCHSVQAPKLKGGLLLDSRAGLLKGGDSGPAIVPNQPEKSRLVEAVGYQNVDLRMPPRGKLPETTVRDLAVWVKRGAPWPHEQSAKVAGPAKDAFDLEQRKRDHWAWQPLGRPAVPPVNDGAWPRGAVDRFILAKLGEKELTPSPPADRRTLLRRVYFDLVGLPPTPAEVEAFLRDNSPDAFEKVVDRLLASPHFGERWGRHWFDLVRYAETRGHEFDYPAPNAYQYRDYVIRAFNADVPYDRFVTEHIAGDLVESPWRHPGEGFNESVLGTGFWFLGEMLHSPVDTRQDEADRLDNMVDVFGKTFLGLTVACARCHDHKFDAISTKDYYALYGFLESSSYRLVRFDSEEHNRQVAAELARWRQRSRPAVQRALVDVMRPHLTRVADYLLAARDVLLAGPGERERSERLKEVAGVRRLTPAVLQPWVAAVDRAARDGRHPLHLWARMATGDRGAEPGRVAGDWRQRSAAADRALAEAEVVVDYGQNRPADWIPDGFTFGPGPVRPGELRLREGAGHPAVRFVTDAAAEKDPAWDGLKPARGAEDEPGAVGGVVRSGRTLRTPTFRITAGKVFYLIKGSGRAYAAVDSHVLINGPLHAALVHPIQAGAGFCWIEHDLTPYRGHHVHVEFTPAGSADFAVRMVVQSAAAPGSLERPNQLLMSLLDAGSPESLATGYQRLLLDVADRLAADRIVGAPNAADYAELANWLVEQTARFDAAAMDGAVAPFLGEQAGLVAQIQKESRLAPAMLDGTGEEEHVFVRGSPKLPGEQVPRRFLEALAGPTRLPIARGSGRLELARQVTDPAVDPLLPRVLVNRVWHHLFGRGIVASVDNFGVLGDRATHPELLDHLATEFIDQGWSIKSLIRSLVLSSTYRMASGPDGRGDQVDPQDLLLHRMRVRRLEGEAIRDALLAVSGRLDRRQYGPPVPVYLTPFQQGRGRPVSGPPDGDGRRSLYLAVRRNFLSPLLLAFDTPTPFSTVGRRTVSNVPAQALILMNDPFVHQQAEVWARRILAGGGSAEERITGMYLTAFGRPPQKDELAACREFLDRQTNVSVASRGHQPLGTDDPAAWADLAHVLINAKEFIFLR